jgi:hypothetical protein
MYGKRGRRHKVKLKEETISDSHLTIYPVAQGNTQGLEGERKYMRSRSIGALRRGNGSLSVLGMRDRNACAFGVLDNDRI